MVGDGAEHDRYEALAVGHVLGGLDEVEAADFRSHLLQCRSCRRRVAELRDIASDLEVAEREELAELRLKTEVRDEDDEDGEADTDVSGRFGRGAALVVVGTLALVLIGLLLWNLHLRGNNRELVQTTETREQVLAELGEGVRVDATFQQAVRGVVVADEQDVTASLTGLPDLRPDQVVVVWLGGDQLEAEQVYGPTQILEGRVAFTVDAPDATRLVVSVEERPPPDRAPDAPPDGQRLVEGQLAVPGR